jgi:hypothetical protein
MGQTHDSAATQDADRMSPMSRRYPCRETYTEQARRSSGEPCDMKVSSTVRRGLFGKGAICYLARQLPYTESVQRILKRRALDGQYPTTPQDIITWLEATARGWNTDPTPFVWAGKRQQRRHRAYLRRHPVGGSAAVTRRPIRFRFNPAGLERLCA